MHKATGMVWLRDVLSTAGTQDARSRLHAWFARQNSQSNNKQRPIRVFAGKGAQSLAAADVLVWIGDGLADEEQVAAVERALAKELGEEPWTKSAVTRSGTLPVTGSVVVGREAELEQIDAARAEGCRVFQIIGPGGRGKTALANVWADALEKTGEMRRIFCGLFIGRGSREGLCNRSGLFGRRWRTRWE